MLSSDHWERDARLCVAYGGPDDGEEATRHIMAALAKIDRLRETLRRAHGYLVDLGDDGNEGAALLARRIAADVEATNAR